MGFRVGDLVRGKQGFWKGTPLIGIIIKESDRSNTWGDERYQWWTVLCEGGEIVDEMEKLMEVIDGPECVQPRLSYFSR